MSRVTSADTSSTVRFVRQSSAVAVLAMSALVGCMLDRAVVGAEAPFAHLGSAGCADCHGAAASRSTDVWKRSYWIWSERDRHRRAFETLYSPRSAAIVRRLRESNEPSELLATKRADDESAYLRQLEERCVGCHATRPPTEARGARDYAAGVSCESCHGPAERWQDAHHGADWAKLSGREKQDRFGFAPLRSTSARAGVCVDCHVGPRHEGSRRFDVDHDLIAAGHPRLSFEFTSALARLTPHWDVARARKDATDSNGSTGESTDGRNFDTWRHGQAHVARALVALQDADVARHGRIDFARVDCFACHHRLRGEPGAGTPARTLDLAALRETPAGLFGATTLAGTRPLSEWLAAGRFPFEPPTVARASPERDSPERILSAMTAAVQKVEARRWDRLVSLDLALRAYLADQDPRSPPAVAGVAGRLDEWLNACFDRELPNRYDSPARFRPDDPALDRILVELHDALSDSTRDRPRR